MKNWPNKLRDINRWLHAFLIEASQLLAMLGFIFGTVDVFTGGNVASNSVFNIVWAIIQAIAVDGLFFAVWLEVPAAKKVRKGALIGTGILLGVVLFMINDILSFQSVLHIGSENAMQTLGLNLVWFTYLRAGLVIVVSVLSVLVLKTVTEPVQTIVETTKPTLQTVDPVTEQMIQSVQTVYETEQTSSEPTNVTEFVNKKQQVLSMIAENPSVRNSEIVAKLGVTKGYVSTLRKKEAV